MLSRPWRRCKSSAQTRNKLRNRSSPWAKRTKRPWWACSQSTRRSTVRRGWTALWQSNGNNRQTDSRPSNRTSRMTATTSDNPPSTNGNSTTEWWSPSTWWPVSRRRGTTSRTCSICEMKAAKWLVCCIMMAEMTWLAILTLGTTKSSSEWRKAEWRCSRMAKRRPWWCPESVACRPIGRVFGVEFDLCARDALAPESSGGEHKHFRISIRILKVCRTVQASQCRLSELANAILCASKNVSNIFPTTTHSFPESKVRANECQWDGYAEPQCQQCEQCAERHCAWAALVPQNQIHNEEQGKDDAVARRAGEKQRSKHMNYNRFVACADGHMLAFSLPGTQHRCQQHVALPFDAAEALVNPCRNVSGRCAEQHEHNHYAGHQSAAIGRRQEAQAGKHQCDQCHAEHLSARAQQHRKQHAFSRWPKHLGGSQKGHFLCKHWRIRRKKMRISRIDAVHSRCQTYVAVHQLPAELLLRVLAAIHLVVAGNVFVQRSQHNHGHHAGQEEHDDQAVENAEPLDLGVRHRLQDVVPSRRPFDGVVAHKVHRVRVRDVDLLVGLERFGRYGQRLGRPAVALQVVEVLVQQRHRFDLDGNDAAAVCAERRAPLLGRAAVVGDGQVQMVVRIVEAGLVVFVADWAAAKLKQSHPIMRRWAMKRTEGEGLKVALTPSLCGRK